MISPAVQPDPSPAATYVPGYAKLKLLMIAAGCALFLLGLSQIGTSLRLLMFGQRATAEATRVIKAKEGLPEVVLTDDAQISSRQETSDRSYVFWNEFRFRTASDRTVDVRATVGSQLKPLYPLVDADGLATSTPVCYDPDHPAVVVFPLMISTWFAPGALVVAGLLAMVIGSFLFYWADKPIQLPVVQTAPFASSK